MDCLQSIKLPLVHHELVKQALCMSLTNSEQQAKLLELLRHLCETGIVSEDQAMKVKQDFFLRGHNVAASLT